MCTQRDTWQDLQSAFKVWCVLACHVGHHIHQNGEPAYRGHQRDYAHNDDEASAATEGVTEEEYADSASDPHGPHEQAVPTLHRNMQTIHSHYAPSTEQDSYEEEHEDTSSEGTR